MHHHHDLLGQAGQLVEQRVVDPGGEHDGQPGVQANSLQVRDPPQFAQQPAQSVVGENQGVAPTEQNLFERGVLGDVIEGRLPVGGAAGSAVVGEVSPKAVPAMDGTRPGGNQQHAPLVLVKQPGEGLGVRLGEGVGGEPWGGRPLGRDGQHLGEQGVVRVAGPDAGQKAVGHHQGEQLAGPARRFDPRLGQLEQPGQFPDVTDRRGELPVPRKLQHVILRPSSWGRGGGGGRSGHWRGGQ